MKVRKKQDDDDDIVFGQSRMSLKDPLSYMRLVRPVRSSKCSHLQCFEAKWWIVGNEKHPQWLCPLCNRALRIDELIVDGFSLDILDVVPEKYDEVVIEADNAWHTEDGAYGSPSWLALNAKIAQTTRAPTPKKEEDDAKPNKFRLSTSPDPKGKRKAIEILSSDDEDDEPPLAKSNPGLQPPLQPRQLSSSAAPASRPPSVQPPAQKPNNAVIDLTLDSDDEEVEDAVTNFDRPPSAVNPTYPAQPDTLAPPTVSSRGGPSTARSPSYTFPVPGEGSNSNNNGYSNGNGNGSGSGSRAESSYTNGHGRPYPPTTSTSTSTTEAARQPTDRYVPPYMPTRPDGSFTFRPNAKHTAPYRPPNPPPPAHETNRPVATDTWRAGGYDERSRKRERDRDREREREMETDSEDEGYRYSRR